MKRRDFVGGLLKSAAAVAVLGPVVLKPNPPIPQVSADELVAAYHDRVIADITERLRTAVYDHLQNTNYEAAMAASGRGAVVLGAEADIETLLPLISKTQA